MLRLRRAIVLACLLLGAASTVSALGPPTNILRLQLTGVIDQINAAYIEEGIRAAAPSAGFPGYAAVLIEIDSPGGELTAMDDILKAILASKVPVITWVAPEGARAGSAATFVTLAGDVAAMAPLTNIVSVFARLEEPIDFEALDNEPVDLIFLLLAPEHAGADHLKALARISRLLREPSTIERLRTSRDRAALYSVLTEPAVHAA